MTTAELDKFKQQLGAIAEHFTDAQLLQIHSELRELAGIIVDTALEAPELLYTLLNVPDRTKISTSTDP